MDPLNFDPDGSDVVEKLGAFLASVPFAQVCGMRLTEADLEAETLTMEMPLSESLERGAGTKQFHGGAIASLIDTAGTFAMVMISGGAVPTINFRTDYLRPN